MTFVGERSIEPTFDLRLLTTARHYDITLAVSGTPGDTETRLTADPTLPEPDIMALLVTGRTLEEMRGAEFGVAREQVFSYVAGRVGSQLGRGVERATGLSTVRLEPSLIANEAEPTARLTVGQEITPPWYSSAPGASRRAVPRTPCTRMCETCLGSVGH